MPKKKAKDDLYHLNHGITAEALALSQWGGGKSWSTLERNKLGGEKYVYDDPTC